jgi:Tol biopolymer transport system component
MSNCLGEPELIQATSMYYIQPFWSPSGTQIAYRDEIKQVKVLDVQTRIIRQFETTSVDKTELIWSNDGRQLIYEGLSTGSADLFAINLLTGSERQLTVSGNEDHRPKLRPD